MGHFERGAWVETPHEKLVQNYTRALTNMQKGVEKAAESMIEWDKHSGKFEKGAEISVTRLIERTLEEFTTSLQNGLNQSFKNIK